MDLFQLGILLMMINFINFKEWVYNSNLEKILCLKTTKNYINQKMRKMTKKNKEAKCNFNGLIMAALYLLKSR